MALGACSSAKPKFQDDQLFSSTGSPYSRNFDFSATDACEAARRGLLSQGYMTTMTRTDAVDATKDFQPAPDSHIDVEVHVVCTAADASNTSIVYVNAVQNGYALKKSDTSASVGLSIFGSLSVPIRTNSDAMVKISSETIQSGSFYDKFFELVKRYLRTSARSEPVPRGSIEITPLPPPVAPSPPIGVTTPPAPAVVLATRTVAPVIGSAPAALDDAHVAAAATTAATATATPKVAMTAVETTASIKPATAAAADAVAATLPGIGEPPLFAVPANEKVATAPAQTSVAQTPAKEAKGKETSVAPASTAPAAASPAAAAAAPAPASNAAGMPADATPASGAAAVAH